MNDFWQAMDQLVTECELIIDRPKGSRHPKFPSFVYPLDYGYLHGTSSADGDGIDVWRGTLAGGEINAIVVTIDLFKRDSEVKLLMGCTEDEIETICRVLNEVQHMKGILVRR
ncbi:MAG: inorganic pyrophosphatase [Oscillospiraceae bacterium]|nr:inorganic pyrophosphatase [Oscillospiraceae bacterium]